MTREDIIRMARESGMTFILGQPHEKVVEQLGRFAALAVAAERKACAKLCEDKLALRIKVLNVTD